MFVTVAYATTDPADDAADPTILDIAVDQAIDACGLVNAWRPLPRTVFANIPAGGSGSMMVPLQAALRQLPATFVVSRTDTAWPIARSIDVPKAKCDATSDFGA